MKETKKTASPKVSVSQTKKDTPPKKMTAKTAAAKEATTKKAGAAKSSSVAKAAAAKDATSAKASTSKAVVEKPAIPSPPAIPRLPEWAEMITELDRQAVEDRIYVRDRVRLMLWLTADHCPVQLREFVVRFGPLLGVAKAHMDALDDFDHLPYAAVKAIVISILDILSIEDESARNRKVSPSSVFVRDRQLILVYRRSPAPCETLVPATLLPVFGLCLRTSVTSDFWNVLTPLKPIRTAAKHGTRTQLRSPNSLCHRCWHCASLRFAEGVCTTTSTSKLVCIRSTTVTSCMVR